MALPLFDAPRMKLRRARHHIDNLQSQVQAYLARRPFCLEIIGEPTYPHGKRWCVRMREDVPMDFAMIIGDAIHNLRATLDLLACDLVRANGGNDKDVRYPFAGSPDELELRMKDCHLDRAKPAVRDLIRESKPYRGVTSPIRTIHDLDVQDKHHALIPTMGMAGTPQIPGTPAVIGPSVGPIHDGAGFHLVDAHAHLPIGLITDAVFTIMFGFYDLTEAGVRNAPLLGKEVIPALEGLEEVTSSLVEDLIPVA
jgi:hypothetical protein